MKSVDKATLHVAPQSFTPHRICAIHQETDCLAFQPSLHTRRLWNRNLLCPFTYRFGCKRLCPNHSLVVQCLHRTEYSIEPKRVNPIMKRAKTTHTRCCIIVLAMRIMRLLLAATCRIRSDTSAPNTCFRPCTRHPPLQTKLAVSPSQSALRQHPAGMSSSHNEPWVQSQRAD